MKTRTISLTSIALVLCGLFAVSSQTLQAQKKGLPVAVVNDNANNPNNNPNPQPKPKAVARTIVKKPAAKLQTVPVVQKQMIPPVQKRIELPKLPAGMKRMGSGASSKEVRDLAKLKLMPPMKRKGGGVSPTFPQIGATSLDQQGDRIRDIAFGQAARDLKQIGGAVGFADLIGGADGLILDFGLGGEGDSSGFAELEGFGGNGASRKDGLPEGAPPSGWGFLGGIASGGGAELPQTATSTTTPDGTVTKTWSTSGNGWETAYSSVRRRDGSSSTTRTTTDEQGSYRVTRSKDSDGTLRETRTALNPDGTGGAETFTRDPDGTILYQTGRVERSRDGIPNIAWGGSYPPESRRVPSWMRDIGGNPGDDGTTESQQALANWMWRQHNLGKTTPSGGLTTTNRVNPGDPDYEGAGAGDYPSIGAKFTGNIAVNPDPNMMSGGGRNPSARAWRLMKQDLINGVNPGPITEPVN